MKRNEGKSRKREIIGTEKMTYGKRNERKEKFLKAEE
jgi:hypothetical protein